MFCPNCGNAVENGNKFCPACGKGLSSNVGENPSLVQDSRNSEVRDRVREAVSHPLFLVLAVLVSVSALLNLIASLPQISIPIFELLLTIFFWIVYYNAKKGTLSGAHLRNVSGTVFAYEIVAYVCGGLFLLGGLMFAVTGSVVIESLEFRNTLQSAFNAAGSSLKLTGEFMSLVVSIITVVFFVLGALLILLAFFGIRRVHRFLKSLYRNYDNEQESLLHLRGARSWIIVFAVLSGLSAVGGTVVTFFAFACNTAACILAAILLPKLDK